MFCHKAFLPKLIYKVFEYGKNNGIIKSIKKVKEVVMGEFGRAIGSFFANSGVFILRVALLVLVGVLVIRFMLRALARILARAKVEKSARYLILIMLVLGSVGISITALIAVFSAAGLALSLALQGSLSNLANGIVIILTKPFKEGDAIKIGEHEGRVREIKMMHTVLLTLDNKVISVPNKMVVDSVLLNSSVLEVRRISYNFLVGYKSDVEEVKEIILKVFNSTNLILKDPAPFVGLEKLESDGIKFIAHCHIEAQKFGLVYFAVLEEIFNEFKRNGITMPHAQMEVRVNNDKDTKLPFRKPKALPQGEEKPAPSIKEIKIGKEIMNSHELEVLEELENKANKKPKIQPEAIEEVDINEEDELKDSEYLKYVNEVNVVEEDDDYTDHSFKEDIYDEEEQDQRTNKRKFLSKEKQAKENDKKKVIIKKPKDKK